MKILNLCFICNARAVVSIGLMSKHNEQCFYAVGVGRKVGIYNTWNECKSQIDGVKNPKFRKFNSLFEAENFVKLWKDKLQSTDKLIHDKKLHTANALDVDTVQKGYCRSSDTEKTQADDLSSCKNESENESLNVRRLQEKIIYCEKKIDIYVNKLNEILSGFKEIKNEFGHISDIFKNCSGNQKRKLSKICDLKPGSSKENFSVNSPDVDLCKDASDLFNDNISQGIKIEDFDLSEFEECQTPVKRTRLSSDKDTDNDESSRRNKKVSRGKSEKVVMPFIKDEDDYVAVYTDGCCLANGYSNAKAGIGIWFGEDHPLNVGEPFRGVTPTNNNAEIQAARVAIEIALKANISKLKIITDSQFLINSVTEWLPKWKRNNWTSSTNKSVVNRVELEKLDKVMSLLSVRWEKLTEIPVLSNPKQLLTILGRCYLSLSDGNCFEKFLELRFGQLEEKVAGHSGIRGNEAADMLANKGADLYVKM